MDSPTVAQVRVGKRRFSEGSAVSHDVLYERGTYHVDFLEFSMEIQFHKVDFRWKINPK